MSDELKSVLESLLFVADTPLTVKKLAELTDSTPADVASGLQEVKDDLISGNRGFQLREIAGGWRLYTHPGNIEYVEKMVNTREYKRLSQAALETIAIVTYKQPVTRAQVSEIRGVNSDAVLMNLEERGLIKEAGNEETPGRPILYRTSEKFLEHAGLSKLSDLPKIEEFEPDEETKEQITLKLLGKQLTEEEEPTNGESGDRTEKREDRD